MKTRILLVEDNPADARLVEELLVARGQEAFELVCVPRLADAQAEIKHSTFDAILLDLQLPDSTGLSTFAAIRDAAPSLPIVVLTVVDDEQAAAQAVHKGAQDYLIKGQVEHNVLARSIQYAIERNAAIQRLTKSEERFELAVRGANDGIWDWDVAKDVVYVSPRGCEILGLPPEASTSTSADLWRARLHPDDTERMNAALNAHLEGLTPYLITEVRVRHADGSFPWILVRGASIQDRDGAPVRMAGSVTDVTARRETMEALRRSEQRYRLLAENATDIIATLTPDGHFRYVSPACRALLGHQTSELTGRILYEWIHPDDVDSVVASQATALATDETVTVLHRMRRRDGTYRRFETRWRAVRDPETNEVTDIVAITRALEPPAGAPGGTQGREAKPR